ncbi:MAG: outer membrane protein assembly factor BamD, partial [Deltaproteobacteria bacterium]
MARDGRMNSKAFSFAALASMLWLTTSHARPACTAQVGSTEWFEWQMQSLEKKISAERNHAIEVLRNFATRFPDEPESAGILFRLAELLWEQAQADFIAKMKQYDRKLDLWRAGKLSSPPEQPSMDLSGSISIYERLLEKFPDFEQADTVLYLYGFALNERGDEQTALSIYRTLLKKYPNSRFVPDAHMALAEYEFTKGRWKSALAHYLKVLNHEEGYLFDLALYKTAWCHFKLGQPKLAAARFRQLLERTARKKKSGIGRMESAAKQLEREAIEDLALTFSESGGARAAYDFMRQIGGPEYSKRVLAKLADVFRNQGRLDKAIQTWRLLLEKFPFHPKAPVFAQSIARTLWQQGMHHKALAEYEKLASMFGKDSPWAREQKSDDISRKGLEIAERSLRFAASARHSEARKKSSRKNLVAAVESYRKYLKHFGDNPHSAKISYQLGEALFELKDFKAAADAYLGAWKALEDKKLSTEALYSAVLCFDRLRPTLPRKPADKPQKLTQSEVAFIDHGRRFVELEPSSSRSAKLELEIGRLLYARGHLDRAARILVELSERLPEKPEAGEAALLACDALQKLGDFARLEQQARKLRSNERLAGNKLSKRLDGIIAAAMFKQALAKRGMGAYEEAAAILERMVEQFPRDELAPRALLLAGASMEKAGKRRRAVALFERVWKEYPNRAADAAYVLADLHRKRYEYIEAAETLVRFAKQFPRSKRSPEALLQAATLYKAKHRWKEQVMILDEFSRRYPRHPKAAEALFEAGLALEKERKHSRSLRLFRRFLKEFASRTGRARQARLHLALALIGLEKYSVAR